MDRLLTETTPPRVYDAVDDLMNATTEKGPFRFLKDVGANIDAIPDRSEAWAGAEPLHPVDDAIEMARFFARQVEEHAVARRWKAAAQALRWVEDSQESYWMRCHVETLRPIQGFIVRGYVTQRVPRIHVYLAEGDVHLMRLPPTSSQEAIEAAIDGWLAGCREGAARAARLVLRTAAHIECAVR